MRQFFFIGLSVVLVVNVGTCVAFSDLNRYVWLKALEYLGVSGRFQIYSICSFSINPREVFVSCTVMSLNKYPDLLCSRQFKAAARPVYMLWLIIVSWTNYNSSFPHSEFRFILQFILSKRICVLYTTGIYRMNLQCMHFNCLKKALRVSLWVFLNGTDNAYLIRLVMMVVTIYVLYSNYAWMFSTVLEKCIYVNHAYQGIFV